MAQTHNANVPHANGLWGETAAARKYDVSADGLPIVGTQVGDTDLGIMLTVPALSGFEHLPEGLRGMVMQSVLEYVQNRIAQPAAKKAGATRDTIQEAVNVAMRSGFDPSRTREKTLVENEVQRQFEAHIRSRIAAKAPDASEADILTTIDAQSKTDSGRAWMNEARANVVAKGTYAVARKGKTSGSVLSID